MISKADGKTGTFESEVDLRGARRVHLPREGLLVAAENPVSAQVDVQLLN